MGPEGHLREERQMMWRGVSASGSLRQEDQSVCSGHRNGCAREGNPFSHIYAKRCY